MAETDPPDAATIAKYAHNPCDPYYGSVCEHDQKVQDTVMGLTAAGVFLAIAILSAMFVWVVARALVRASRDSR